MNWVSVGKLKDFEFGIHRRETPDTDVLIAVLEGQPFAFEPTCPHGGGSLIHCEVLGKTVSCPLHGWTFDLARLGRETHGFRGLRTFSTRVVEGLLEVNFAIAVETPETRGDVQ